MNILRRVLAAFALLSGCAAAVLVLGAPVCAGAPPSFREVRAAHARSDAVLLDRHGAVLHELRIDAKGRRLEWTPLKDISPSVLTAVVQAEDKRFYRHSGVDWVAAGSAVVRNLFSSSARGASTISMQLAALIDKGLRPKKAKRTVLQKLDQMEAAEALEAAWTKDEILEAYLNLVTFKGELQGIAAASRGLFDKEPHGLDSRESLLLAALIRSPNASVEGVADRACRLSAHLGEGVLCEELKELAQSTLKGTYYLRQRAALAPHVAYELLGKGGALSVASTLEGGLQRFAAETLRYHLNSVKSQNVNEGAVLIVDNGSGEVLAYVGNVSGPSGKRYVDGVRARRQAGSTLKPFLYGMAFEKGVLSPASLLNDSPLDLPTALGLYKPDNYDNNFKGMVSARTALASSLNIPAVRVIGLIGVDPFAQRLSALGFTGLEADEYYGPSLALGAADVTLFDLVNAYRTLANGGLWSPLRLAPEGANSTPQVRVMPEHATYMIADILSDREARGLTFGLENALSTRFWTAVKTGTSKDMRDNWCIGFSGRYTVGVWVGNFSGEPMWNVSGVSGAAPVWHDIMNRLHGSVKSVPPARPETIIARRVEFSDGGEPPREELFRKGTEVSEVVLASAQHHQRIAYPAAGTIIALDPDMPDERQLVLFEASAPDPRIRWTLDGEPLGKTTDLIFWKPQRGRHRLALVDEDGAVIDTVSFEVRGNRSAL